MKIMRNSKRETQKQEETDGDEGMPKTRHSGERGTSKTQNSYKNAAGPIEVERSGTRGFPSLGTGISQPRQRKGGVGHRIVFRI